MNAEFQRIAKGDKRAFLSEQCKVEENNKMGKTKKIRDTKGTFHAKMGTIKDNNSKDLMEAEEMATHSSVLAWRIPGTGKPGGLYGVTQSRT